MEKKKTTEEEYDLSYYLGGNEEDTYSKPSKQKDKFIPEREVVRKQEKRTPMNQSGIPSENSEHEQHVVSSQDAVPSQHTENTAVQRRISAKMRKETLEAYKQAYLVPTKLIGRKAVYLSREHRSVPTSSCVGWATGEATFQVLWRTSCAFIWRNMVRI